MRKLPINIIIKVLGKNQGDIFTKRPYGQAKIDIKVVPFLLILRNLGGVKLRTLRQSGRLHAGERREVKERKTGFCLGERLVNGFFFGFGLEEWGGGREVW